MVELSGSFRTSGKSTSISHNNRDITDNKKMDKYHQHIQWQKTSENIVLQKKPIKEIYRELFDEEVNNYNTKQKRKDRKIDDYYLKVKNDGSLDLQREFIIQIGDKNSTEEYDIEEVLVEKLIEYYGWFKQEFPDLKIYNAVIHLDETTPHLHLNVVPVANGYKQGMAKRPSFSKWLQNNNFEFKEFRAMQSQKLSELIQSLGAERKEVGTHEYIKPSQYREIMQEAEKVQRKTSQTEFEHGLKVRNLLSKASELEKRIETKKIVLNGLESEIRPLEDEMRLIKTEINSKKGELQLIEQEKQVLKAEIDVFKSEKEILDATKHKYFKSEPQMTNVEVQGLITNTKTGLGGLKGITLEALKSIGTLVSQLFETIKWMREYIKHLEIENKKLKEPHQQKVNKFEQRLAEVTIHESKRTTDINIKKGLDNTRPHL